MKGLPEERAVLLGQYIVDHGATVRQTAGKFQVSKSTVHKDVTSRLKKLNASLYAQVVEEWPPNESIRRRKIRIRHKNKFELKNFINNTTSSLSAVMVA